MPGVARDADDLHGSGRRPAVGRRFEIASERVLTGPQAFRERAVDHRDRGPAGAILVRETAAALERDAHRPEEPGSHERHVGPDAQLLFAPLQLGLRRRLSEVKYRSPAAEFRGRNRRRPAHGLDAWDGAQRRAQRLEEPRRGRGRVSLQVERVGRQDDAAGGVAGRDGADALHAAEREAGADEQRDGEGDLRDDERLAQPRRPAGGSARGVTQRLGEIRPAGLEKRRDREADGDGDRRGQREGQHARIRGEPCDADAVGGLRDGAGRHHDARHEPEAGASARERQQHAFGQQLARDSAVARAERAARRQVAAPCFHPGEDEIADVAAGDQQQEARGRHEHAEERAHLAAIVGGEADPGHQRQLAVVAARKPTVQRAPGCLDFRDRRGEPGPRRQASDDLQPSGIAVLHHPDRHARHRDRLGRERQPDGVAVPGEGPLEFLRRDADDGEDAAVDRKAPADGRRVAAKAIDPVIRR